MRDAAHKQSAAAVIVAGGTGERFGRAGGKQLAVVAGAPVIAHTLRAFLDATSVDTVVLVCHPDRVGEFESVLAAMNTDVPRQVVAGGSTRQESVRNGLAALDESASTVVIHDGARPLVTRETIDSAIAALESWECDGVVIGHPSFDTLKHVDSNRITGTPDRARYWTVQTPQVFRLPVLLRAHDEAARDSYSGTDDASLLERQGNDVRVLEGPRENIKVTVPEDLAFIEAVLRSREDSA